MRNDTSRRYTYTCIRYELIGDVPRMEKCGSIFSAAITNRKSVFFFSDRVTPSFRFSSQTLPTARTRIFIHDIDQRALEENSSRNSCTNAVIRTFAYVPFVRIIFLTIVPIPTEETYSHLLRLCFVTYINILPYYSRDAARGRKIYKWKCHRERTWKSL